MQPEMFNVMNAAGLLTFSFTGAMRAIRQEMDLLGVFVIGIATAFGGGIIRDMLVNRIPYALLTESDMILALAGTIMAATVYKLAKRDVSNNLYVQIPDALGLAAFTSSGAIIAHSAGVSVFGIIILATITGVGGGVLGDIFSGRVPAVLKDDFYATCSVTGSLSFFIALQAGLDQNAGSLLCSGITLCMRLMALQGKWRLPRL